MSASAAEARKKELEQKRQKLAIMKQAKSQRDEETTTSLVSSSNKSNGLSGSTKGEEFDKLLADVSNLVPGTSTQPKDETINSSSSSTKHHDDSLTINNTTPTPSPTLSSVSKSIDAKSFPHRKVNLVLQSNINEIDIPPKEIPTYTKATQTDSSSNEEEARIPQVTTKTRQVQSTPQKHRPTATVTAGEESSSGDSLETEDHPAEEPQQEALPELSLEEKEKIIGSEPFQDFVDHSARIMDRVLALNDTIDLMKDYRIADEQRKQTTTREAILKGTLFDERWSKHRSITDLGWSAKHPELLVASYSANEAGSHDPDGVVLVWTVNNFFQKPEFVFHTQSPVTTVMFSKFHSTLVAGGTYAGQIVLWDTRAKSIPVQRTPLSSVGHTHPLYSIAIVGSANAHNLVSVSTDGKLCVWNLENLSHPTETLELTNKSSKPVTATAPVAATTLSFPEGEVNSFFVGSEEGAIFQGYRHGSKSGVTERFDGHYGPVTATDFHPARGNIDFSHLFLSSSTDWTCKLWSHKFGTTPLYSFEDAADYVYDVRWSPTHPAVFATADGLGYLDIWNLNDDTEVPVLKARVGQRALNRIAWSADGRRIIVGDANGSISLFDVGEVAVPDSNEWNRLEEVLGQLASTKGQAQQEEDAQPVNDGVDIPDASPR